jgi:hypothetical protein
MNHLQSTLHAAWLLGTLLVGLPSSVQSQQPKEPAQTTQPVADVMAMTAQQFEVWVGEETERSYKTQKGATPSIPHPKPRKPPAVDAALVRRLRAGKAATDLTVREVVSLWRSYEQRMSLYLTPPKPDTKPFTKVKETTKIIYSYPETKRLVEILKSLLYGRPLLQAELQTQTADLVAQEGDQANAVKEYEKAITFLTPLERSVEQERLDTLIHLADILLELNDKKGALALYSKALHYSSQHLLSQQQGYEDTDDSYLTHYERAGTGMVNSLKGDLKALQALKFTPWAKSLNYVLAKTIEEAGGPNAPSILEMEFGGLLGPR